MPSVSTSSAVLILRAQGGDRAAYARLVEAVSNRVRLYARLRLGPRLRGLVETEDVLQEAWLEAHRSLSSFVWQGEGSFTRWVSRIVEHRIHGLLDHHGAAKRLPPAGPPAGPAGSEPAHASPGPGTGASLREDSERLLAAMDALEDDARSVLLLRFHLGQTLDETAHALGRSVPATRRLLGRALLALGEALGREA